MLFRYSIAYCRTLGTWPAYLDFMMTRGDEMLLSFAQALTALEELRLEHYVDDDIREVVEPLASKVERFFKSSIFPGTPGTESFDTVINRLKTSGVSKTTRKELYDFRELYNGSKHDPLHPIQLRTCIETVRIARDAMISVIEKNLGTTATPVATAVSRTLWVTAYDVYVGGVTEVYVSLPWPNDDFATHLDIVWVKGTAWDNLKAELLSTGSFHYGPDNFTPEIFRKFNEDDFVNAGVWDGEYRQLIQILSKYEDRATAGRLIPDLRRDHMSTAVLSAIAMAGVDVASQASHILPCADLANAILTRADDLYAMPAERPWVKEAADEIAALLVQLDFDLWATLVGPFWNLWNPRQITATVASIGEKKGNYVIDDMTRLVIV